MILQSKRAGFDFLSGAGEMGRTIRAFDWSNHPLGDPNHWPQSLKTSVSLILNSQHPMWIGWGRQMWFLYNDAYLHVLGLAKHPWALGRPAREVWAEIWDVCGPLADKVFEEGEASFVDDVRLFMNRGDFLEETYYSFSYSPIRDESGEVGGLFCPSNDVSPKVIGARRLRTLSELAANALVERTTSAACTAAMTTLAKNPDDIPFALLYVVDPEAARMTLQATAGLGYSGELLAPASVDLAADSEEAGIWPIPRVVADGEMRQVSVKHLQPLPAGPAGQPVAEAIVVPVASGRVRTPIGVLIAAVSPTRRLDSDYRAFLELVATNIATAIQNARAAEQEKRRADVLAELDRAKTQFFSNVSHEFRTPLTLMLGPLETVLSKPDSIPSSQREQIETAHRNSLRLLKLVNSLLDFSRIEAGRVKASYEPVDLSAFTTDLASNFRSAMQAGGLKFTVDCAPLSQPVYIDRDMWEKIVLNLLSNAFKFTFEGSVSLRMEEVGGQAVLAVSDTGLGIPEHELPRIFERFHRVEGARGRTYEGTGIGLALIQELAKLHGGTVEASSRVGEGSTFTVRIPFGSAHLPPEQVESGPGTAAGAGVIRGNAYTGEALSWVARDRLVHAAEEEFASKAQIRTKARILIADDNSDMREHVIRILNGDYAITAVADGAAALKAARAEAPDLILSDVMMPLMDGFALLKELRADEHLRHIPIILISARAGEEARTEGIAAGADDYVTKPFNSRELLARVRTALELHRVRREAQNAINALNAELTAELSAMARLQQLSTRLVQGDVLTDLLGEILEAAIEITNADKGNIQLYQHGVLKIVQQRGFEAPFLNFFSAVEHHTAACGTALGRGERVIVEDVAQSPIFKGKPSLDVLLSAGVHAVQATPLIGRSGRIMGMLSTHYGRPHAPAERDLRLLDVLSRQAADLIERDLAEQGLRESEERLALAVESGGIGTWDLDLRTGRARWSRRHFEILGYSPEPDRHMTIEMWRSRLHPEDLARVDETIEKARSGQRYVSEHRIIRADDAQVRWLSEFGQFIRDASGELYRFIGVSFDVTPRKAAEDQIARSQQTLSELIERAPFGVYIVDSRFRIAQMNVGSQKGAFRNVSPVIGRDFAEAMAILWPEDVAAEIVRKFRHTLDTGESYRSPRFVSPRHDVDTVEAYEWELHRMTLPDGQNGVICYYFDSTDLRNTEAALRRANQDLEQFAYSASHDLQEPLRTVKVYSEMLAHLYADALNGEALEYLQFVASGASRMEALVHDLLTYTQSTQLQKPAEPQDSGEALQAVLSNLAGSIEASGAQLTFEPMPMLHVHATHLQQLFQNVIGNAIKYRRFGVSPVVHVGVHFHTGCWVFSVSDNGIGIEAEYKERIFELFKRLHTGDEYSGTGIGLALCQRIVERYGGRIWVESEPGEGSTFYFTLPA
ncbi:MAG: response regulator [Acidobacteriia bacterium]|nr:response regulator [Terriglobia bacterium]